MSRFTQSSLVNVMSQAAFKAARGLLRDFGEVEYLQVSQKGAGDFVSSADHRSERIIREELQHARPKFGFIMEESGIIKGEDPDHYWIVDPLDGTHNFLHGLPHFCITIALEYKKEILAGIVYDPLRDELFWSEKGKGAYVNKRRLYVSKRQELGSALFATGIPYGRSGNPEHFYQMMKAVMPKTAGLRRFGAAALDLAYVAAGRYDGYFETHCSLWDIAAGTLLVQEARGTVTEIEGGKDFLKTGSVLASNSLLHQPIQSLLSIERVSS